MSYVNAGHPPMIHLTQRRLSFLADVHRPWLGVRASTREPTTIDAAGTELLLLLYTDGLIEQRSEPLDRSLGHLIERIDATDTADGITQSLIGQRQRERNARTVDDDIAIVTIKRHTR